jgi:hypothetical protein
MWGAEVQISNIGCRRFIQFSVAGTVAMKDHICNLNGLRISEQFCFSLHNLSQDDEQLTVSS